VASGISQPTIVLLADARRRPKSAWIQLFSHGENFGEEWRARGLHAGKKPEKVRMVAGTHFSAWRLAHSWRAISRETYQTYLKENPNMKKLSHFSVLSPPFWRSPLMLLHSNKRSQRDKVTRTSSSRLFATPHNTTRPPTQGYSPALGCVSGPDHGARASTTSMVCLMGKLC